MFSRTEILRYVNITYLIQTKQTKKDFPTCSTRLNIFELYIKYVIFTYLNKKIILINEQIKYLKKREKLSKKADFSWERCRKSKKFR